MTMTWNSDSVNDFPWLSLPEELPVEPEAEPEIPIGIDADEPELEEDDDILDDDDDDEELGEEDETE